MNKKCFSTSELLNASKTIYQAQFQSKEIVLTSVKDIYNNLCYILGPHYWGHEYSWEVVHSD